MKAVLQFARWVRLCLAGPLLPVLLFGGIAGASDAGIPALPNTSVSRPLLTTPWTVADLDGDHNPDLARSNEIGSGLQGYIYRVEVQLSGGVPNVPFTISTHSHLGLNIVPRDIDGDNDLDLVITTGALHQPVGIWLNDGKGAFTRAEDSLYPAGDGTQGPGLTSIGRKPFFLLPSEESQRPISIVPGTAPLWRLNTVFAATRNSSPDAASLDRAGEKSSRAPPLRSLLS